MTNRRKHVFAAAVLTVSPAFAEDVIALHCVGDMTETVSNRSTGTIVHTESVRGERYYELSASRVIEHKGTLTVTTTRSQLEGKEDNSAFDQSGNYTIGETQIVFTSVWRAKSSDVGKEDEVDRQTFLIDRQTGRWSVNESYTGPMIDLLFGNAGVRLLKHFSAEGYCEPWNPARKF